jgi:ArsR family transcriptional regulator, repressor of sdpIR and other operons
MHNLGKVFHAMADPTRRRILEMLGAGDLPAGEIAEAFAMSKPAISHHLSVLKQAGLAAERREGQKVIYSLEPGTIAEAWNVFMSKLCTKRGKK